MIEPNDDESQIEAYHAVFTWLVTEESLYRALAKKCGAKFKYLNAYQLDLLLPTNNEISYRNCIVCQDPENSVVSTHYKYINHDGDLLDPYNIYQLYNTHGECFGFALYLAWTANGNQLSDLNNAPIVVSNILQEKGRVNTYKIVNPTCKQLAYKLFVNNDWRIIQWLINLIESSPPTIPALTREWTKLEQIDEEDDDGRTFRETYGVPLIMTFAVFWTQFKILTSDIRQTRLMTLDQINNWDKAERNNVKPFNNSGIKGADGIDIENYVMTDNDESMLDDTINRPTKIQRRGGRKTLKRATKP
jgi:hypothetical protein